MLNIIRMDLHRLTHSISFWVMIATAAALALFSTGMTKYSLDTGPQQGMLVTEPEDEIMFGITVETNPAWIDGEIAFTDMVNTDLASCLVLILCVIFVPLFVNGEQKNGFVKNIAGQLPNRGMLIVSKLFAAAVQVFVVLAVHALFIAVAGCFFWGGRFVAGSLSDFLTIFGLHYLLHFSFSAIVLMMTVVSKSSALSMTFGILCSAGLSAILYNFINVAVHFVGGSEEFDIARYMVEMNIACVGSGLGQSDLIRILAVGIAFLVASSAASMAVMQKRDIR